MELIQAAVSILDQTPGLKGIYEQIEIPGRICYGSTDKICDGSAEPFVHMLEKSDHGAPMEHGWVTLKCPGPGLSKYEHNPYSKTIIERTGEYYRTEHMDYPIEIYNYYVSTNYRVLYENGWLDDLQYLCEPTRFHEPRITASFTVDRFTGEEFLRHRKGSFNRESTRFIDLMKDKFGAGSIKFITPCWCDENLEQPTIDDFRELCVHVGAGLDEKFFDVWDYWVFALYSAEYSYGNLRRLGWTPEQARTVLPCAICSPLIMTAFLSDWIHFFNLRVLGTTGKPHPQAKQLAEPLMNMFIERGLIKLEDGKIINTFGN